MRLTAAGLGVDVEEPDVTGGLPTWLFSVPGTAATPADGGTGRDALLPTPARGLVALLPGFALSFGAGAFGDVARFATTECPPMLPPVTGGVPITVGDGEPVRDGAFDEGRVGD